MYSYSWDSETGGLLLNSSPLQFSKEPRPVYYKELDILGFDQHWKYDRNDSYPYMWAEANSYFYRGRLVAKTKGGSLYTAPELIMLEEPEPNDAPLRFVDVPAMVEKNHDLLEKLVQDTIKKIYNTYVEYRNKVDVFYVAFSGGKDSVVAFDLVQRALPHNKMKVLFGDTGMEFPDTYDVVDKIKEKCEEEGIDFLRSKCEFEPEYTWSKFGPPAQTMRWCCSVHKTAPQVILLRKYTENPHFRGMAFTGIRGDESASRSEYDTVSLGEKIRGQYSCHPILEWNSAELFLYIYDRDLVLNAAYKKGNSRAGCLVCPLATSKNMFFKEQAYSKNSVGSRSTTTFNDIILNTTAISIENMDEYTSMFSELPVLFQESALVDRIHGFIKGWDIPKMKDNLKASGWALNSEYFCTVMHMLRDDASYRAIVDALVDFSDDAYVRHTEAVKRIATAYLKLLFPNVRTASDVNPKEFMKYCLRPAIKMRKIIWRQLSILDAEYKNDDKLMPEFTLKEIRNEA